MARTRAGSGINSSHPFFHRISDRSKSSLEFQDLHSPLLHSFISLFLPPSVVHRFLLPTFFFMGLFPYSSFLCAPWAPQNRQHPWQIVPSYQLSNLLFAAIRQPSQERMHATHTCRIHLQKQLHETDLFWVEGGCMKNESRCFFLPRPAETALFLSLGLVVPRRVARYSIQRGLEVLLTGARDERGL